MARAGSRSSLVDASENLLTYARLEVTPKQVQRVAEDVGRAVEDWNGRQDAAPPGSQDSPATVPILYVSFDGTGVPMRKSELHSSKCKGPDGKARTREVKLACIFTPNTTLTFSTATNFLEQLLLRDFRDRRRVYSIQVRDLQSVAVEDRFAKLPFRFPQGRRCRPFFKMTRRNRFSK